MPVVGNIRNEKITITKASDPQISRVNVFGIFHLILFNVYITSQLIIIVDTTRTDFFSLHIIYVQF